MRDKARILVLTENTWLFEGLRVLLPELDCRRICFGVSNLPWMEDERTGLIIFVDDQIFLRGGWKAFIDLHAKTPDVSVLWLTGKNSISGQLPLGDNVRLTVSQRLDIEFLRRDPMALKYRAINESERYEQLTQREWSLLPLFMADVSLPLLARWMGISEKTLYNSRQKIMMKMGFRRIYLLQYIYKKNGGIPVIR
ncbi:TPA: helix-turn-helix transcriptional regulator [Escherichia coli]|nr:transcriptional regulator [Escherichia coli]